MGFFGSLFSSDLCTEDELEAICDRFSKRIVVHSISSAHVLNYMAQMCTWEEYDKSYDSEIRYLYKCLCSSKSNWDNKCSNYLPPKGDDIAPFTTTITKFMYYHMTRLPIMLNSTTYNQEHFSKKEKKIITQACLYEIMKSPYSNSTYFNNDPIINLNRDYWEADKLKKEEDKMKSINNYSFFMQQRKNERGILNSIRTLNSNQGYVFFKLLDDNFKIFYKSLQDYLSDFCIMPFLCVKIGKHNK